MNKFKLIVRWVIYLSPIILAIIIMADFLGAILIITMSLAVVLALLLILAIILDVIYQILYWTKNDITIEQAFSYTDLYSAIKRFANRKRS